MAQGRSEPFESPSFSAIWTVGVFGTQFVPYSTSVDLLDVLRRCQNHDEAAWQVFHVWFRRLASRVLTRFPDLSPLEREEAEDAARVKVALEISHHGITGTSSGEITNFGKRVVTNCARDIWKRRRPTEPLPPLLRDDGPSPFEAAKFQSEIECAKRVLAEWGQENRCIFMMKLDNIAAATIKADLERLFGLYIAIESVDARFSRLRAELRQRCFRESASA